MLKSIPITLTNNTEPCQILKMECLAKILKRFQPLNTFAEKPGLKRLTGV